MGFAMLDSKRLAAGERSGDRMVVELLGVEYAFRYCAPNKFFQGSPPNEPLRNDNEEQHVVALTYGYWMQETQVTQKQWTSVMGDNPSHFQGDERPVEQINWFDCQNYIERLNRDATDAQSYFRFSLPTEAEWENACRAETTTPYSFGSQSCGKEMNCNGLRPYGYGGDEPVMGVFLGETTPVGAYPPNRWGFYDMHGNVWEWTRDWYGEYFGFETNPTGPVSGSQKIYRGGGWGSAAECCRSAFRHANYPNFRYFRVGMRLTIAPAR